MYIYIWNCSSIACRIYILFINLMRKKDAIHNEGKALQLTIPWFKLPLLDTNWRILKYFQMKYLHPCDSNAERSDIFYDLPERLIKRNFNFLVTTSVYILNKEKILLKKKYTIIQVHKIFSFFPLILKTTIQASEKNVKIFLFHQISSINCMQSMQYHIFHAQKCYWFTQHSPFYSWKSCFSVLYLDWLFPLI